MKQLSLMKIKQERAFGGTLNKGRRKAMRPLSVKKPVHLVLKATSSSLLLRHQKQIRLVTSRMNRRFGVKDYSIGVHADHVHLVLRIHSRDLYRKWIRAVTSLLVREIAGLKFKLRPYTLILSWGRQFKSALRYVKFNQLEGDLMVRADARLESWREEFIPVRLRLT